MPLVPVCKRYTLKLQLLMLYQPQNTKLLITISCMQFLVNYPLSAMLLPQHAQDHIFLRHYKLFTSWNGVMDDMCLWVYKLHATIDVTK